MQVIRPNSYEPGVLESIRDRDKILKKKKKKIKEERRRFSFLFCHRCLFENDWVETYISLWLFYFLFICFHIIRLPICWQGILKITNKEINRTFTAIQKAKTWYKVSCLMSQLSLAPPPTWDRQRLIIVCFMEDLPKKKKTTKNAETA